MVRGKISSRLPIVLLLGLCLPFFAVGQVYFTETGHAQFDSKATVESFSGTSENLTAKVNLADSTLDVYLDLATLTTGISLRDEHMRENHLETDTYPYAEFFGKIVSGFDSQRVEPQIVKASGHFQIHGVERPLTIEGTMRLENDVLYIASGWSLKLSDYKISRPAFLFLKLSETQQISVKMRLERVER